MILNAPKVEKFKPLQKHEVDNMIKQIDDAFAMGVPPTETVAFPAMVLAQLLKTVQHLASLLPPPPASEELFNDLLKGLDNEQTESMDDLANKGAE